MYNQFAKHFPMISRMDVAGKMCIAKIQQRLNAKQDHTNVARRTINLSKPDTKIYNKFNWSNKQ